MVQKQKKEIIFCETILLSEIYEFKFKKDLLIPWLKFKSKFK